MIVGTFGGLRDIGGPSFGRRVVILETLAKYRSCVVMLDLECDDLVNEMFRTFLNVARFALFHHLYSKFKNALVSIHDINLIQNLSF